jgi:hypothetical protein
MHSHYFSSARMGAYCQDSRGEIPAHRPLDSFPDTQTNLIARVRRQYAFLPATFQLSTFQQRHGCLVSEGVLKLRQSSHANGLSASLFVHRLMRVESLSLWLASAEVGRTKALLLGHFEIRQVFPSWNAPILQFSAFN